MEGGVVKTEVGAAHATDKCICQMGIILMTAAIYMDYIRMDIMDQHTSNLARRSERTLTIVVTVTKRQ